MLLIKLLIYEILYENILYFVYKFYYIITYMTLSLGIIYIDVPTAKMTSSRPCFPDGLCQKAAHVQGLAGCDALTSSCVCKRGYVLKNDICLGRLFRYIH